MRIALAAPIRPGTTSGNDVTAHRWAQHLAALGHRVDIVAIDPEVGLDVAPIPEANEPPDHAEADEDGAANSQILNNADLLVVLHARRSAAAARWWRANRADKPMIVALAGTDLYADLPDDANARWSIDQADALVVLQEAAIERLASFAPELGAKAVVIHQSLTGPLPDRSTAQQANEFRVVVLSHLRDVKDPLMCARAARLLPGYSTIVVHHVGGAHSQDWEDQANEETEANPRYWWHGPLDRDDALELLSTATVLACTSLLEGGANVVTEAIAMGVPVVGTLIDGNTGLLGKDYPGLVPAKDDQALADLLLGLEAQPDKLAELTSRVQARRSITEPATEQSAWNELLARFVN